MKNIVVIGLWHQGIVGAACFAKAGHQVRAFDQNREHMALLKKGKAPLFEPGLDELIQEQLKTGRLVFANDLKSAVEGAEFVCLMFDTPVNEKDEVDLSGVIACFNQALPYFSPTTLIWVTAQIPVGTCQRFKERLLNSSKTKTVGLAYSPENLRLGNAIELFEHPALPVIGTDEDLTFQRLREMLSFTKTDYEHISLRSAEMVKHALNAFLATSVSFGNEIGNLCDQVGADALEIARVLRREPRIGGKAMLSPGMGFAGGTLARDVQALRRIGRETGLETPLLEGLWEANQNQNLRIAALVEKALGGLKKCKLAVWGLTYKPGTSTLRRSAAIEMIQWWRNRGCDIYASDPKADKQELAIQDTFTFYEDPYKAIREVDGLVIVTPWPEYSKADFLRVKDLMTGSLIVDPNNFLDIHQMTALGFHYIGVGRGRSLKGDVL